MPAREDPWRSISRGWLCAFTAIAAIAFVSMIVPGASLFGSNPESAVPIDDTIDNTGQKAAAPEFSNQWDQLNANLKALQADIDQLILLAEQSENQAMLMPTINSMKQTARRLETRRDQLSKQFQNQ